MWLWWGVSLIVLVISIIFAIKVFASSRQLQKLISIGDRISDTPSRNLMSESNIIKSLRPQEITELMAKLRTLEENVHNYTLQLNRMEWRLTNIESAKNPKSMDFDNKDPENWEELYFEILDKKENLESELEVASLKIEQSESRISELHSQLDKDENVRHELKLAKQQNARMQIEVNDLRSRISEANNRDILIQQKLTRLSELESMIHNSEFDKTGLRNTVNEIILENELLTTKLTELQERLLHEK